MFQIGTLEPFLTTVGKLNFFRWAIEKGILEYIRHHTQEIEREMNLFMKDIQKEKKTSTASTTTSSLSSVSTVSTVSNTSTSTKSSTRRRVANKEVSTTKIMQKHDMAVEVRFD